MSCANESTKLTPQVLNYQLQKRRTLSWERIQGYVELNNKCGTRFDLLCHWLQTLIRRSRTKQNWSFTRVIASLSCVWYLIRPWNAKICRQNEIHYYLTLKILSPFSFSASSYMWWLESIRKVICPTDPSGFQLKVCCLMNSRSILASHHARQLSLSPALLFIL